MGINIDYKHYLNYFDNVTMAEKKYFGKKELKGEETDLAVIFPMHNSVDLTKILVNSLLKCQEQNKEKIEIIIVDNFSDINVKMNMLIYLEHIQRIYSFNFLINFIDLSSDISYSFTSGCPGSILNAFGLHAGIENIASKPKYIFLAHHDVMFTSSLWFSYLRDKISDDVKLAGFRKYYRDIDYLHVSGYMFQSSAFNLKELDFFPSYEDNGRIVLDVGDKLSDLARIKNYKLFITNNTFNKNVNENLLTHPYNDCSFDRAVDHRNNVLFMHLGRGTSKAMIRDHNDKKKSFESWRKIYTIIFEDDIE